MDGPKKKTNVDGRYGKVFICLALLEGVSSVCTSVTQESASFCLINFKREADEGMTIYCC